QWRPRDIHVEAAVANGRHRLTYHFFEEPAMNTFDAELARQRQQDRGGLLRTLAMETTPLAEILDRHLPPGQLIDFLSVDVEKFEMDVLKSNDWAKYRPRIILAECLDQDLMSLPSDPVVHYLGDQGYTPIARTIRTTIFKSR
ncbi:MAG: FkbM family methyltransferase, partial [Lentisphaerota bacterium]